MTSEKIQSNDIKPLLSSLPINGEKPIFAALEDELQFLRSQNTELQQRHKQLQGLMTISVEENRRLKARICDLERDLTDSGHKSSTSWHEGDRNEREDQAIQTMEALLAEVKDTIASLHQEGESSERLLDRQSFSTSDEACRHQRIAILVDVQNVYYSAKYIHQSKLSYQKLLTYLSRKRELTRAIAYVVQKHGSDQEGFLEVLKRSGYEVRIRHLIERSDGSRKGDWDMGIAIDALALADKVDVVILVSGDGDFIALVNMLKSKGVRVEIASFAESTSDDLIQTATHYWPLDANLLIDN